jgi:predicted nucleic acid-binding protein
VTVILDASTLINLVNGEVLGQVLSLPGQAFQVSSVVRDESRSIARAIDSAVASQAISLVNDTLITASEFAVAKAEMNLDDGETECILAAQKVGAVVATDDRAARIKAEVKLGAQNVCGSIGLIKMAVAAGLLSSQAAYDAYQLMKQRGGFLPDMQLSDF